MKLNKSTLLVSIAAALLIFGAAVALSLRFGFAVGIASGLTAFFALILVMLIANHFSKKQN